MSDNEKELLDIPDRVRNQHLLNIELREQLSASRQEVFDLNDHIEYLEQNASHKIKQIDELREALEWIKASSFASKMLDIAEQALSSKPEDKL